MSAEILTTISPTTNQGILTRQVLSPQEISELPKSAQKAFKAYQRSHPSLKQRQSIVTKALGLLLEQQDELAKELTQQMGRPIAYTAKEITTAVKRGEYLNRIASEILDVDAPGEKEQGFKRYIRKEPLGVVLIIFAWNVGFLCHYLHCG